MTCSSEWQVSALGFGIVDYKLRKMRIMDCGLHVDWGEMLQFEDLILGMETPICVDWLILPGQSVCDHLRQPSMSLTQRTLCPQE